ncbi:uncharacterized protein CYBJADRAFT_166911 [Cyberlindnera jadinii NRRL Y-1542]|uniref:DUF833-domain-containing protein n=1 Tax=Cyberlindnera jadinii (strain ATCC 18201 / CBS 1600 / BCRC 20928 / JCM 3617 / NBRC 0987 / NRRL Y-1542) TaxID=983966 RepID=A0A1E4S429_CYBJN|nr:DUF833-domain-containing protein [Cyberlindnera jadinii NRRL Y-1542]ODV74200.1 DUF833-domain-containing protein [Cyberlindnera jadinii NRRL Y-1542]
MCILLITNAHPQFPFILCSNRDEFLARPTHTAHQHVYNGMAVFSPQDLARVDHGTWIALNPQTGQLAVLVNYREGPKLTVNPVSRGVLPLEYVTSLKRSRCGFLNELRAKFGSDVLEDIGGFSLMFGTIGGSFDVVSNKTADDFKVFVEPGEVHGLSNSKFDQPWEKVNIGEHKLREVLDMGITNKDELVEELFKVLSLDTMRNITNDYEANYRNIENSIFIPPLLVRDYTRGNVLAGKYYGTRTQTVILQDLKGSITYIERNLHSSDDLEEKPQQRSFEFTIPNVTKSYFH